MKKLLAASVFALGLATLPASAADFTLSEFAGTGNFGSITGTFLANGTTAEMTVNMGTNVLVDTGGHFLLTLSLLGGGTIDQNTLNALNPTFANHYTVQAHDPAAGYNNDPFKGFTDAVAGDCSPSMGIGCGSTFVFDILNFGGFAAATTLFNGQQVFAAVDILLSPCSATQAASGGCTGAVGTGIGPTPTQFSVPGPIVGAGLPGLLAACAGLVALGRRRRRQQLA
jgi:hypothetical protein